jgi:hypothetical protein
MSFATRDPEAVAPELVLGMPAGLRDALGRLGAGPVVGWREAERVYLRCDGASGGLFARYSPAARDAATFEHEAAVRRVVGGDPLLRTPAVVAGGPGWLVERHVAAEPLRGPDAIARAVEAAERIATISLPRNGVRPARPALARRIAAAGRSPLPARDLVRARAVLAAPGLPNTGSHGDFHPGNLLLSGDALWVVDWERVGTRPWGYDLMRLHATVERDEDREDLLARAIALAGPRSDALLRLAYALLVRTIADKLLGRNSFDRDPLGAERLLGLLPRFRP